jgi:hypothetical protein
MVSEDYGEDNDGEGNDGEYDNGEDNDGEDDNGGDNDGEEDNGEDNGIVNGNTPTDSTSEVSNEDLSMDGQKLK